MGHELDISKRWGKLSVKVKLIQELEQVGAKEVTGVCVLYLGTLGVGTPISKGTTKMDAEENHDSGEF